MLFSQGTGLQAQSVFREKLTFRPHSTSSQTHRKMTLSIADRASKAQKIRVLPAAGMDPEAQRSELIKVRTSIIFSLIYTGEQTGKRKQENGMAEKKICCVDMKQLGVRLKN